MPVAKNAPKPKGHSQKHAMVDKANAVMIGTIAAASIVIVFSFFAARSMIKQYSYQSRVIKQKKTTLKAVTDSSENVTKLVTSYKAFANSSVNVLGGNPNGNGPLDGDNPRIVLDALPSKYDFPGLVSSLEKLLKSGGYKIDSVGGTESAESASGDVAGPNPSPVEIPFPLAITSNYQGVQSFVETLEASIRPIYIKSLTLSGADTNLQMSLQAKTYYQPEKIFDVTNEAVQ